MAMGASPDRLLMSVFARTLRLAAIGAASGLAIALGGAQIMKSLLFAVDPRDPITFVGVTILLGLIAIVACVGPALKASRVDPMTTLRAE
jgi:ABC-type antimicrobial peptide transport system permease subunit